MSINDVQRAIRALGHPATARNIDDWLRANFPRAARGAAIQEGLAALERWGKARRVGLVPVPHHPEGALLWEYVE